MVIVSLAKSGKRRHHEWRNDRARDSVVNVSQIVTIDRAALTEHAGRLDTATITAVAWGVRLVLGL